MKFEEGNNLLYPKQHGFRAKLSCETQLVELVADISKELYNGKEVDACLLDFSKAFDKVSHAKLLAERRSHRLTCLFRAMHFAEVNAPLSDFVVSNKQTGTR